MSAFLTPADVAERWSVHPATVRAMCRRRQLRAMRIGDTWRIKPADVEAFEAKHTTELEQEQARMAARVRAYPASPPALDLAGDYVPVVKGRVPWRSEVVQ